jgi:alanine dehydrogenase
MVGTKTTTLFERLATELVHRSDTTTFAKRTVELLVGTDRFIGRKQHVIEKRVGVTPDQIRQLHEAFRAMHLTLRTYVIAGAGARAGYADGDYVHAGAEIVGLDELEWLDGPPDVVHALKEPSPYEARVPKPFCRIGALHSGDFDPSSGLAELLVSGDVAVFDGSNIGASRAFRIPIRGRMSRVAGQIAAEWVIEHLDRRRVTESRAIVVGGGYAGQAAVERLLEDGRCAKIHLFDDAGQPARLQYLRDFYEGVADVEVGGISGMDDPTLLAVVDGAFSIIFAVARPKQRAPKTIGVESLARLKKGGLVVDISIDEGGSIHDPTIRATWSSKETIPYLTSRVQQGGHDYRAISNMPRAYPYTASSAHGEEVLPYIATLLFLSAKNGGTQGVLDELEARSTDPASSDPAHAQQGHILEALMQDLRNGLAISFSTPRRSPVKRVVVHDIIADKDRVCSHLYARKIPFELGLPSERDYTISGLEPPVQASLEVARKNGVNCTFVSHPGVDGTRTADAARALGVAEDDVLKCIILKCESGGTPAYAAAICEGTRRINMELFAEIVVGGKWELATPDDVVNVTAHSVGGVPVLELPALLPVYVSHGVLAKPRVWASAGSEYVGMSFAPAAIQQLGGKVAQLTRDDSVARRHAHEIRNASRALHDAIADDDDDRGRKAVRKLVDIFGAR